MKKRDNRAKLIASLSLPVSPGQSYRSCSRFVVQTVVSERAEGEWRQVVEGGRRRRGGRNQLRPVLRSSSSSRHQHRCRGRRRR